MGISAYNCNGELALHILTGSPLLAPGSDGINGVNLANAIQLSSWLGKKVENPVDEDLYLAELTRKLKKKDSSRPDHKI